MMKDECDQQPAHSSVAVQERVDRFKLDVHQSGLDERRIGVTLVMQELFQRRHAIGHPVGRRGDEMGVSRARPADPVLGAPKLAGGFLFAAPAFQKQCVHFPDQTIRKRETLPQSLDAMVERRHVIGHFHHVADRNPGGLVHFEQQQLVEGGLRAFDL